MYINGGTTGMLETLQTNAGSNRETSTIVQSTDLIVDDRYCQIVSDFVEGAHSEIRLCAYAWRWYENEPEIGIQKLNIQLLLARMRGVKVRCLVDTEAQKNTFTTLGFDARCVINTRMLHTKAICVDAKRLVIGSHNMTKRAMTDNYEMSLMTAEVEPCLQFIEYFDRLWNSRG